MKSRSFSSSSFSSSSSSSSSSSLTREKFLSKMLLPSIRGESCPICLKNLEEHRTAVLSNCLHAYCLNCIRKWSDLKRKCPLCNSDFASWYCFIISRHSYFRKERLKSLEEVSDVHRRHVGLDRRPWIVCRSRDILSGANRTRQLPLRRTFGRPGSVSAEAISERKLQWRASIYTRQLQAVPLPARSCQNIATNTGWKERMLQRSEPWIRRELQAILRDPDPSIVVHVATSVFIATLEETRNALPETSEQSDPDHHVARLQPFLDDLTKMFWHELRCFADSSLTMEAYDSVVEYRKLQ